MAKIEGSIEIPEELLDKIAGGALSPEDKEKIERMVGMMKGAGISREFCFELLHPKNPADFPEFSAILDQYYG